MGKAYQQFAFVAALPSDAQWRLDVDQLALKGTGKAPDPPRDVQVQAGARKVLVTWKLPVKNDTVARWRIYRDTENNLVMEIADKGTRQMYLDVTAGATPPVYNFFVSALNVAGKESVKVQAQGSATAEAGAPPDPSVPTGYTDEAAGGGDTSYYQDGVRGRSLEL